MKSFFLTSLIVLLQPLLSVGQPSQGSVELSLQGYYSSTKSTSDPSLGFYNPTEDLSQGMIFLRAGYFLTDQFSLDPEITWNFSPSGMGTKSLALSLNGTFHTPVRENLFLFGTAGAGLSDKIPNIWMYREKNKFDVLMFNAGFGLKYFVAEIIALRTEYRYQSYRFDEDFGYFGKTQNILSKPR